MLSDEQKKDATLVAMVGCDRETIAKYVGCTADDLLAATQADPAFAADLRRAEAGCELAHMRSVQQAARDERHWRASVWWLERRLPSRYARRAADAVGRDELSRFLAAVAQVVATNVEGEAERRAVLLAIERLAAPPDPAPQDPTDGDPVPPTEADD